MNILIAGGASQLAGELRNAAPAGCTVFAPDRKQLDITQPGQLEAEIRKFGPELLINTAAYTNVEGAEDEPEEALRVNAGGAEAVARACADRDIRLIHLSTDYVFDGGLSRPYRPDDATNPLNHYGVSKAEGEKRIRAMVGCRAAIIRTSWLYASAGRNFVKTILAAAARGERLRVVDNQIGTPTWAGSLARTVWMFARRPELEGIFHWTDAGVASWYDFSVAILEEAFALGLLQRPSLIVPVPDRDYPTRAIRPRYSVLDKTGCWKILGECAPHWRVSLRRMLEELKTHD